MKQESITREQVPHVVFEQSHKVTAKVRVESRDESERGKAADRHLYKPGPTGA